MKNRKLIYGFLMSLILLLGILGIIIFSNNKNDLNVVFLDVGQGDAILISQGSQQMLIDGGKDGTKLLEKLGAYIPFWDRTIETVLATHPDQDHIGGLIAAARAYKIETVMETKMRSDSQTFKKWEDDVKKENAEVVEAKQGVAVEFSNGARAEVLYPFETVNDANSNNGNAHSVVVKLTYGENTFLLTGDLPSEQEKELLAKNADLQSGVLKVSHHGSKYATSEEFLNAVAPQDAIISVGKNNSYGHPNQEVIQRLLLNKISIFRTDEIGDIVYGCDNQKAECVMKKR